MARILAFLAGLAGGLGVGLLALGAHYPGGAMLGTAGTFLLIHGAAFLALSAVAGRDILPALGLRMLSSGWFLGLVLFCGDLAMRVFFGMRLFTGAAPIGGSLLIVSWVVLAVAAVWPRR